MRISDWSSDVCSSDLSCIDNRPLRFAEWDMMRPQTVSVSATPGTWEMDRTQGVFAEQVIRPTGLIDPPVEIKPRSEEHTSELQSLMRTSYAVFCLITP